MKRNVMRINPPPLHTHTLVHKMLQSNKHSLLIVANLVFLAEFRGEVSQNVPIFTNLFHDDQMQKKLKLCYVGSVSFSVFSAFLLILSSHAVLARLVLRSLLRYKDLPAALHASLPCSKNINVPFETWKKELSHISSTSLV